MPGAASGPSPVALDIRFVPPPERQPLALQCCTALEVGQWLLLISDHDPQPMHDQLRALHPGQFGWTLVEQEPGVWRVRITRLAIAG